MSQLLVSDLTALSSETKRKNPDVRAACDAALTALRSDEKALLKASRENVRPEEDTLLKTFILACSVKGTTAKVVSLAVGLLQRIIAIKAIKEDEIHLETIVDILANVVTSRADVDVHLKVLQVVSSLLSTYHSIHDQLLSKTLHLCFRLQDSRVAVVSSTAAATLRQAVMIVFEKVREEDSAQKQSAGVTPDKAKQIDIPGTDGVELCPSARDAYYTIADLNSLANGEEAPFLSLHSLPRTFTLELIESILTNHSHLFRSDAHPELLFCLRQSTCPLLIKAFNEQAAFPTTLRLMRLLFVLLRQFSTELVVEVEVLMSILLKFVSSSARKMSVSGASRSSSEAIPPWQRVLAMEATRSLCADGTLLRNLWKWYDAESNSARVFTKLVDTLHLLATENPAVTGKAEAEHQMSDAPHSQDSTARRPSNDRGYSSALYGAAAGVATAAINGFSTIADTSAGLSQTSVPSVQLIDQLDKSEAPVPPPTYIYLLALQSLVHLAQSLAACALPVYSRFVNARPSSAPRAPPALDFSTLSGPDMEDIKAVKEMLQQSWAPLLNSFTFFLTSRCDDVLFAEVLIALRNFTNATGVLGLDSPRDALIATLTRFAVPRSVIAKLVSLRGKSASNAQDDLDCTLSERNAACLKAVTQIAYYLSGSLSTHWRDVLETLCDAEFVLRRRGSRRRSKSTSTSEGPPQSPSTAYQPKAIMSSISALSTVPPGFYSATAVDEATGRPLALTRIDSETLLQEVGRVFENTQALGDEAFLHFIDALCELDADSVGLGEARSGSGPGTAINRSFPLSSLATVAMLNIQRLTLLNENMGWKRLTRHILLLCESALPPPLRLQAAEALDTFLKAAMQVTSDDPAAVQMRTLLVLAGQCTLQGKRHVAADIEVRRLGLEALLTILEKHGHSLLLGWELIFNVCAAASAPAQLSDDESARPTTALIKVAFTSLQLVCADLLSKLNLQQLEGCVKTLTMFGNQKEDVNVALTANGTLWAVTAEIRARQDDGIAARDADSQITSLWIYVLKSVLELTADERAEVRNGAIAILFNVLEQYGSAFDEQIWTQSVMKGILLPLLDELRGRCFAELSSCDEHSSSDARAALNGAVPSQAKQWVESRQLALASTGKVVQVSFIDKLMGEVKVLKTLFATLQQAFLDGPASSSQAAIGALQHILQTSIPTDKVAQVHPIWRLAWQTWLDIGAQIDTSSATFTQSSLLTYVKTIEPIYQLLGTGMPDGEVHDLLLRLKTALTYAKSEQKVSDSDRLTALQSAVLSVLSALHITPSTASMVLKDLAEYTTLAFRGGKGATYLALNRASTERMCDLYMTKWSAENEIYESGAVSQIFSALLVPVKLRYDCPGGKGESPIWKGSLVALCKVASLCSGQLDGMTLDVCVKADVFSQMERAVSAALCADCSAIGGMSLSRQQEEQIFDLTLLNTIEKNIWPFLGKEYVSETCISNFAEALAEASRLYTADWDAAGMTGHGSDDEEQEEGEEEGKRGKVRQFLAPIEAIPRELFAYWAFDLLLLMSGKTAVAVESKEEALRKRVAALFLPHLRTRISTTLKQYHSDSWLRGAKAGSRIKDEELNYILDQLKHLQLWPSSLLVAQGKMTMDVFLEDRGDVGAPQQYALASSQGLLFLLYPILCDLLSQVGSQPSGSAMLRHRASCRSSLSLALPVELPDGFTIGQIGRPEVNKTGMTLRSSKDLIRALLDEVGKAWQ